MSQPKGMSSRLMTMKFMQRAAASGVGNGSSPTQTPPDSPSSRKLDSGPSTPAYKRRKTSGDSPSQRASAAAHANDSDLEAISAAIQAEDDKRSAAIARQAAETGETEWVLEFPTGSIKSAVSQRHTASVAESTPETDAANADADADADDVTVYEGRKSYGGFKKKRQTETTAPPAATKPDTNAPKGEQKGRFKDAMRIGQISSGGGSKGNNSRGGKGYKNRK
ncbi:hypothetical protein FQN49_005560 [Arthroderma sp. PD_2]|nr:hypothetical protein FQN49_005560 [Arthroderma sp. PD_2]